MILRDYIILFCLYASLCWGAQPPTMRSENTARFTTFCALQKLFAIGSHVAHVTHETHGIALSHGFDADPAIDYCTTQGLLLMGAVLPEKIITPWGSVPFYQRNKNISSTIVFFIMNKLRSYIKWNYCSLCDFVSSCNDDIPLLLYTVTDVDGDTFPTSGDSYTIGVKGHRKVEWGHFNEKYTSSPQYLAKQNLLNRLSQKSTDVPRELINFYKNFSEPPSWPKDWKSVNRAGCNFCLAAVEVISAQGKSVETYHAAHQFLRYLKSLAQNKPIKDPQGRPIKEISFFSWDEENKMFKRIKNGKFSY